MCLQIINERFISIRRLAINILHMSLPSAFFLASSVLVEYLHIALHRLTIDSLASRLETDSQRKTKEHLRKKVCSGCNFFSAVTHIRLI